MSGRTAIDVFAGCGGLSLGLKQAGFTVCAAVELADKAARVYALNHPSTRMIVSDVRAVDGEALLKQLGMRAGDLDLLAGCPPCQGFSRIRRRNRGLVRDKRNSLIDEFGRLTIEIRPKLIMMENVAGLAEYRKFKDFLRLLRREGYFYEWATLDVADYGVPQKRLRLILVASASRTPRLALPIGPRRTVHDAIGNLAPPGEAEDILHNLPDKRSEKVAAIISALAKDGGSRKDLPSELQLLCHERSTGFADVYGRMAWKKQAPTITSGCNNPSKGRFIHPEQNRAITLREAALLQGFPASYKFDPAVGKEALASMIGNALPPPFVEHHARNLLSYLQ